MARRKTKKVERKSVRTKGGSGELVVARGGSGQATLKRQVAGEKCVLCKGADPEIALADGGKIRRYHLRCRQAEKERRAKMKRPRSFGPPIAECPRCGKPIWRGGLSVAGVLHHKRCA